MAAPVKRESPGFSRGEGQKSVFDVDAAVPLTGVRDDAAAFQLAAALFGHCLKLVVVVDGAETAIERVVIDVDKTPPEEFERMIEDAIL